MKVPAAFTLLVVVLVACRDTPTVCAGLQRVEPTLPDTVTLKVGAAAIAIAGQSYGFCRGVPDEPRVRLYSWRISDSTVVAVSPIDSIHARITALRPGAATVTPAYRAAGPELSSVRVMVVP